VPAGGDLAQYALNAVEANRLDDPLSVEVSTGRTKAETP
jgi:hypothetical protein